MRDRTKRGWTLVELMIVVAIVGVFASLVIFGISRGCTSQRGTAEPEARKWAQDLGLNPTGVSCANLDTDGDGYVSCTVATKDEKGNVTVYPVECAQKWSLNSGCKTQLVQGIKR